MVHCKQNNVDIQNFLASLLLVTSQTRSASVELREVEALSNLRRRRPRGPSLGRISRRKAAAVSLENKNFASFMYVSGAGPRPCSLFLSLAIPYGPAHARAPGPRRCDRHHIAPKAATIGLGHKFSSPAQETSMRTMILAAAALAAVSFTSVQAHADGAWCARDTRGGTNCGFHTFA